MKILQVSDFYEAGGAEITMQRLTAELASRGHKIVFAAAEAPSFGNLYRIQYSHGLIRHLFRRLLFFNGDPVAYHYFRRLVEKIRPDIIHCHNLASRLSLETVKVSLNHDIPCIITVHDYWPVCMNRTLMKGNRRKPNKICDETDWHNCSRDCMREPLNKVPNIAQGMSNRREMLSNDGVSLVAVSNYVKSVLQRFHYSSARINMVYNGVDMNVFKPTSYNGDPIVLFLGGDSYLKGIEHFIAMAKRIRKQKRNTRFVVTGGKLAHAPDFIENPGRVSPSTLIGYYQRALCTCVPSLWPEPLPTVVLESMACAKPVVVYGVGGLGEIVENGKTGFLVRRGDLNGLTETVSWLIENENVAGHMGLNARNYTEKHFTIQRMCDDYEQLYEKTAS